MHDCTNNNRMKNRTIYGLVHIIWEVVLFGIPLIYLVYISFKNYNNGQCTDGFTFNNYSYLLLTSPFRNSLFNTIVISISVSVLITIVSMVMVILLWNINNTKIRDSIVFGCFVVFFAGVIPRAFALEFIYSPNGIMSLFKFVGLTISRIPLLYSYAGIILAYFPILLPLSIAVLYVARKEVLQIYIDAANDLGASYFATHRLVLLPLMRPGIIISLVLSFIWVMGDVIITDFIGGSRVYTAALQIVDYVKIDDWGSGAAAAVVLLVIVCLVLYFGTTMLFKNN